MLKKNIAKSKKVAQLNLLLKRSKLAAIKAIANPLTLRHHLFASFISPNDYEFSCSNSPAVIKFLNKNKNHHRGCHHDDVSTIQKVLEILNKVDASSFSSPSPLVTFPGFGKSPVGKKFRVTDSPFPLKEEEGDDDHSHVDVAAEEFIKKFYKNLNLQQKLAAIQSPYNNSRDK
ncbi:Avr9/Cf-9 rapidly elicited protein [Medicago truncatula]|nr:Avr9/Cf-9 rapidly elicited protein [Medicago truncatula]